LANFGNDQRVETARLEARAAPDENNNVPGQRDQNIQEPIVFGSRVVGQRFILPFTFRGSKRQFDESYRDAMSVVCKKGKPDLFITFTANSNWREITENIAAHQDIHFRPDLEARVFRLKIKAFIDDLFKKHVFGKPIAYIHVIEFQKRGHPHAHIIVTLKAVDKIVGPDAEMC
jgi:hypothetical protein